ncbi:MAG: hypothetical protein K6T74_09175 [Geminicoccaceae bacterium]|nr:hypothetical protein [Geminicoccaceae bacterium]
MPIDWEPRRLRRRMFAEEAIMERFLAETGTPARNAGLDRGRPFVPAVAGLATAKRPGFASRRCRAPELLAAELGVRGPLD